MESINEILAEEIKAEELREKNIRPQEITPTGERLYIDGLDGSVSLHNPCKDSECDKYLAERKYRINEMRHI